MSAAIHPRTTTASGTDVRVRFCPSPTGLPHVGMVRTALYNWAYARHTGGKLIFRVEDTDAARDSEESYRQLVDALTWLKIDWDEGVEKGGPHEPYRQSQRRDIYAGVLQTLIASGAVYESYSTAEEIDARNEAAGRAKQLGYDNFDRDLTDEQKAAFGKLVGQARGRVTQALVAREEELAAAENAAKLEAERVDITAIAPRGRVGARHPISLLQEEIADLFVVWAKSEAHGGAIRGFVIEKGTKAPQAAGVIHSDFERGFIRAQTIAYDDFVNLGGEVAAKEAGKARDEGKEYVVQDGDVMLFKFNT